MEMTEKQWKQWGNDGEEGGVKEGCHETAKDDIGTNKHVEGTEKHA